MIGRVAVLFSLLTVFAPVSARAHRDDYIDETFVYQTLERHELEFEAWAEARSTEGMPTQGWYTAAFEAGVTTGWMLDAATQWVAQGNGLEFGRLRSETRYRFAEEGRWPLDMAVSAEYEMETAAATGGETDNIVTPRLILSRDLIREVNTTLNLDFPLSPSESWNLSFAYAVGLRYRSEGLIRIGTELKGEPSRDIATLFPQVWVALPDEITLKVGAGIGLTSRTDDFVGRVVLEKGF